MSRAKLDAPYASPGEAGPLSKVSLSDLFSEHVQLAATYAEDGACYTSARILRQVADELEYRARCADAFLASLPRGRK